MIKVIVVEDNDAIREGLKMLIEGTEGYTCVSAFPKCETMLKELKKLEPDVLLMDIGLPGMNGIEGIRQSKAIMPDLNILVLTVYEENELVFEALCAGACGYLVKKTPPSRLLEAIGEAHEGGAPMSSHIARKVIDFFQHKKRLSPQKTGSLLTPREREILAGLVEGNSF